MRSPTQPGVACYRHSPWTLSARSGLLYSSAFARHVLNGLSHQGVEAKAGLAALQAFTMHMYQSPMGVPVKTQDIY